MIIFFIISVSFFVILITIRKIKDKNRENTSTSIIIFSIGKLNQTVIIKNIL
jgi:hypothetical protein